MINKKNIFLWSLYDFANSFPTIAFFLYFSQWLVIDNGVPDIWYNLIFVGSTILLILTAPIGGSISDKVGIKMPYLSIFSILMFLGLMAAGALANFFPVTPTVLTLSALTFLFANYVNQFTFVFYNPLLNQLAPSKLQGFVSGVGLAANWLGQISALLITLPLATGALFLIGAPGRPQTLLPATLIFFLLALPMLIFFQEKGTRKKVKVDILEEYKVAVKNFISLCKVPGVGRYLLAYFFFNDAMLTAVNNFPIYVERVFQVNDQVKSILAVGILVMAVIGALVTGWFSDKLGLKKSLVSILASWIIAFPIMAIAPNFIIFTIMTVVLGLLYGATWTVSRAVMSYLAPEKGLTHSFSYFTLAERFSTFVGPLSWGLITLLLVHTGDFRYRVAMATMAVFVLIGLLIVRKIPAKVTHKPSFNT